MQEQKSPSDETSDQYGLTLEQRVKWLTPKQAAAHPQIHCRPRRLIDLIEAGMVPMSRRVGGTDERPRYVVQLQYAIPAVHTYQRVVKTKSMPDAPLTPAVSKRPIDPSRIHPAARKMVALWNARNRRKI